MKIEKLYPEFKDNIWGGKKLINHYGKECQNDICAESWELSFHPDGPSRIASGELLASVITKDDLGKNADGFEMFPMMIKLIDAKDNLSVQVHPSDEYALKNENSYGKTEMWYIVEADEGAGIYLGFSRDVTKDEVEAAIADNSLSDLMNFFEVKSGDCFFIPSGTIHAIGTGCLIYEIQQNSNLTYRVYDYGRRDKNGNTRELHIDKALKVLDLSAYERSEQADELLGISKYFTARKITLTEEKKEFARDASGFRCVTVVKGGGSLNNTPIHQGDSYFIPATADGFTLSGNMTVILAELRGYGIRTSLSADGITAELYDDTERVVASCAASTESEAIAKLCKKANVTLADIVL